MAQPRFHRENLNAYRQAIRFVAWAEELSEELKGRAAAKEHLDRASTSMVLNLAEGNGKRSHADRCRFFDIARASGVECAACLDVLAAKRRIEVGRAEEGKVILVQAVSMISGLISRYSTAAGEEAGIYGLEVGVEKETREGDTIHEPFRP